MRDAFPAAVPEIPVTDMNAALDYYVGKLGFNIDWGGAGEGIAGISKGHCRMFLTDPDFRKHHGNAPPVMIWLNLDSKEEVDELHEIWNAVEARIISAPESKPWNLHEFTASDLDGNLFRVFYDFSRDANGKFCSMELRCSCGFHFFSLAFCRVSASFNCSYFLKANPAENAFETDSSVMIRFTITDTGIGISEEAQKRLFQAFTQADGSTTRQYGGTGLGLSISKQLVQMMAGEIGVNSTPGKGSTFWFTASFGKQPGANTMARPNLENLESRRVLIVDDNKSSRRILGLQLQQWEMSNDEADSAESALQVLRKSTAEGVTYDLAVLDLLMPEMNGVELARAIRSNPEFDSMKLIILTPVGQRSDGAEELEDGIAAYLTKPVRQSLYSIALNQYLAKRTLRQCLKALRKACRR
jgi:CheY-like chemotaxis protein/catechol 2,3-dioxygenase-like lactoylglutathione lyase family enzyme